MAHEVIAGVTSAVYARFFRGGPDPAHPEVPAGSIFLASFPIGISQMRDGNVDIVHVMTTADGGLAVLVNPVPTTPIDFGRSTPTKPKPPTTPSSTRDCKSTLFCIVSCWVLISAW